ncbi:unnamed protein product [Haemonchus placei]|uniref:Uncharacterized protein n=1 Tax=Haemonchus placei TaxID=6290 RepID=A0A0N4WAD3_HAEPC|nr:unnamed protein product [Haemonchus placei]
MRPPYVPFIAIEKNTYIDVDLPSSLADVAITLTAQIAAATAAAAVAAVMCTSSFFRVCESAIATTGWGFGQPLDHARHDGGGLLPLHLDPSVHNEPSTLTFMAALQVHFSVGLCFRKKAYVTLRLSLLP